MFDLIIIGGGPAGVSASIYAARKHLKTLLITETIGGQSIESFGVENWIGTKKVSGEDLAKMFEGHLEAAKGKTLEIKKGERVAALSKGAHGFEMKTESGASYEARSVLIASGAERRKLTVPGAEKFENKGLTYCASCDGPLFSGQDVAVIGGGNAGFETAAQLLAYTKSVTLLHRRKEFKADPVTVEKVCADPKMKVLTPVEPTEILGEQFVTGLKYKNIETGEEGQIAVGGIFVEIGTIPNTDFAKGVVELDEIGRVKVNPKNQRAYLLETPPMASDARHGEGGEGDVHGSTATKTQGPRNEADEVSGGVWAAGDVTNELYHQNNIAAGDGVKALEDIYLWLKRQ